MSSMLDVQNLRNDYQIIFPQETWLAKQQRGNLFCFSVSHFAFRRADHNFNDGLIFALGHGETVIYWCINLKLQHFQIVMAL